MGKEAKCRTCDEPIEFERSDGRWVPMDPETHERHRCKIDVRCQGCDVIFQGAPWMTKCPTCFKGGESRGDSQLRKDRVHRSRAAEPQGRPVRESLNEEGFDDDLPPF